MEFVERSRHKRISVEELKKWEEDYSLYELDLESLRRLKNQLGRTIGDMAKAQAQCRNRLGLPSNNPVQVYHGYLGPHHKARQRRAKRGIPNPLVRIPAYALAGDPSVIRLQNKKVLPRYEAMMTKVKSEIKERLLCSDPLIG